MRWLIYYLRSAFCEHTWERAEEFCTENEGDSKVSGIKVSATCTKCGWHRKYWKFSS